MSNVTVAVLGAGGIGRRTLELCTHKPSITPIAACDRRGVAIDGSGLNVDELLDTLEGGDADRDGDAVTPADEPGIADAAQGEATDDPIQAVIDRGEHIDGVLLALPNYEHDFIPRTADRFVDAGFGGVLVDVLKRSRVIGMLEERNAEFQANGITFVCGAGATPGLLTGAAALAAQSFVEVESVDIWWGVGLQSGYQDNRGTVREDIAHLPEYDLETARSLSDDEIEAIIDEHGGVLEFTDMEHADDVLLERAGVCDADDVTVGGILDVRNDEKPTTTTVTVTGRTVDGHTATNTFQLGDETSMAANVNGPALGYLQAAVKRNRAGEYGVFGPAELLPQF